MTGRTVYRHSTGADMTPREKVRAILIDRWSLDEEDGWDEFGDDTLDDIAAAYLPHRDATKCNVSGSLPCDLPKGHSHGHYNDNAGSAF